MPERARTSTLVKKLKTWAMMPKNDKYTIVGATFAVAVNCCPTTESVATAAAIKAFEYLVERLQTSSQASKLR